jgi:hypothetical protein
LEAIICPPESWHQKTKAAAKDFLFSVSLQGDMVGRNARETSSGKVKM